MKRRLAAGGVIAVLIAAAAIGTWAYITATDYATNIITTGTVKMQLDEYTADPEATGPPQREKYPEDPITGVMPGQTISKIPVITNIGTQPFYLRAQATVTVTDSGGNPLIPISIDIDVDAEPGTGGWIYSDGWYYYKDEVAVGDEVTFFENVTFDLGMGNEYQNCDVVIDIDAQAVQAKNNEIPDDGDILNVLGWPENNG